MHIFLSIFAVLFTIMTLLPLSKKEYWWIRIFDYPRVQIATVSLFTIALIIIFGFFSNLHIILMLILGAATCYQAIRIFPYTPFAKVQTLKAKNTDSAAAISIFVNNVRMYNKNISKVLERIQESDPDIILLMEPDKTWAEGLQILLEKYPYHVQAPLENTYGMMFFSRLKLHNAKLLFLVEDYIPSIHSGVELPSGDIIDIHCLHPSPPAPHSDTEERDAEIIMVAKKVKQSATPAIVMGDLNDVAWSHTTRLFLRISGMGDPRIGRGFFNTYNAFIPVFRFPLDHIFHTTHFRLAALKRLKSVGSDHFPMFATFAYAPEKKNTQDIPKPDSADKQEAKEKIDQVK